MGRAFALKSRNGAKVELGVGRGATQVPVAEGEAWTSSHGGVEVAVLTRGDSDVPEPLVCLVLLFLNVV